MGQIAGTVRARCALLAVLLGAFGCARAPDVPGKFSHKDFFLVAGSHQAFTCEQCHDPSAPGFSLAEQGVSCTGCHTDAATTPAHASVAGYRWTTGSCIACHKDGSGGLPANHDADFFPVTNTKHATLACSQCHGATKAIADITCVPCHTQSDSASIHAAIPATWTGQRDGVTYVNYQWASSFCLRCHADGQVNRISSHPQFDNGLTGRGHAPFCLTCHASTGPSGGKAWSADFSRYSCLACHSSNNPG